MTKHILLTVSDEQYKKIDEAAFAKYGRQRKRSKFINDIVLFVIDEQVKKNELLPTEDSNVQ